MRSHVIQVTTPRSTHFLTKTDEGIQAMLETLPC